MSSIRDQIKYRITVLEDLVNLYTGKIVMYSQRTDKTGSIMLEYCLKNLHKIQEDLEQYQNALNSL